jgi:Tol biopolymer transport system component
MRNGPLARSIVLLTLLVAAVGAGCGSQQPSSRAEGKIAFVDDSGSLAIVDADGSGKAVIAPEPPDWQINYAVWSPDGSAIAFDNSQYLATAKADGSGYAQLYYEANSSTWFTWSGHSDRIAFVRDEPRRHVYYTSAIFVVRAAGGEPRMLVDGDLPSWSPDGRTIAFVRGGFIRLINGDGTGERRLARFDGSADAGTQIGWSSDSRRIAYTTPFLKDGKKECESSGNCDYVDPDTTTELCRLHILNADGQPDVQVIGGGLLGKFDTQCDIAWSPEGTRIAFTRNGFIYSVNADGTHEQRLARGLEPSWSPDGRHVAFLRNGSIHALDIERHVEHRLVRGEELSWSPDGAFLVVRRVIKQRRLGVGKFVVETMRPDGTDRRAIWPQGGGNCDCGDYPVWQPR